jgi:hypothetical protein
MAKDDERARQRRRPSDAARPATTFAGNVMAIIVLAMLFDDDEDRADSDE